MIVVVATVFGAGLLLAPEITRFVSVVFAAATLIAGAFCLTAALWGSRDDKWSTRAGQLLTVGFLTTVGAAAAALVQVG